MDFNRNYLIHGTHHGLQVGQNERTDELNRRLESRHFPDIGLAPCFDPRPLSTKYATHFPIVNSRKESIVKIKPSPVHYVELNFNPGTQRAPPSGFIENVDVETSLRNQTVALQHGAHQGVYVPSSLSDLYNTNVYGRQEQQTHPTLFEKQHYTTRIPSKLQQYGIGANVIFNHTRTQLRSGNVNQQHA